MGSTANLAPSNRCGVIGAKGGGNGFGRTQILGGSDLHCLGAGILVETAIYTYAGNNLKFVGGGRAQARLFIRGCGGGCQKFKFCLLNVAVVYLIVGSTADLAPSNCCGVIGAKGGGNGFGCTQNLDGSEQGCCMSTVRVGC